MQNHTLEYSEPATSCSNTSTTAGFRVRFAVVKSLSDKNNILDITLCHAGGQLKQGRWLGCVHNASGDRFLSLRCLIRT